MFDTKNRCIIYSDFSVKAKVIQPNRFASIIPHGIHTAGYTEENSQELDEKQSVTCVSRYSCIILAISCLSDFVCCVLRWGFCREAAQISHKISTSEVLAWKAS